MPKIEPSALLLQLSRAAATARPSEVSRNQFRVFNWARLLFISKTWKNCCLCLASIGAAPVPLWAQSDPAPLGRLSAETLTAAEAHAIVSRLASLLTQYYVHPETGQRYADMLRHGLAAGDYTQSGSPDQLAKKLTQDLQITARDGHLRVIAPGAMTPQRLVMESGAGAVEAGKWIAEGVAYIRLGILPGSPDGIAAIENVLRKHAEARALIIDARATPGGSGAAATIMMSYFFGTPQTLLKMEMRAESYAAGWAPVREGPSVQRAQAPLGYIGWQQGIAPHDTEHRLQAAKIFYLTSKRTGSAAEAMALALKRAKRAVLIGENTYGAGYFTRPLELGGGFSVNLPIGRTFDPDTGKGFEGTGVAPDVVVPAQEALREALRLAGVTDEAKQGAALAAAQTRAEIRP